MAKIPSTATGKITEIRFGDDDIIPVGHVILKIEEEGDSNSEPAAAVPENGLMSTDPIESSNNVPVQSEVRDKVATAPPGN